MSIESAIERVSALHAAMADPALLAEGGGAPAGAATAAATTGGTLAPAEEGTGSEAGTFAAALEQASLARDAGLAPATGQATGVYPGTVASPGSADAALGGVGTTGSGIGSSSLSGVAGIAPGGLTAGGDEAGRRIVAIAEGQAGRAEQPLGSNEGPAIAMYRSATRGAMPGAPWCAYFASWVARQAGEPIGSEGQGLGSVGEIWSWAQSVGRAIPNGPGVVPKPGDLIVFGDEHVGIVRGVLPNGKIATVEGNYENKVALNERSPSEPTGYVEMS